MRLLVWILLLCIALVALHRFALWAERRGWIYYRHRKGSSGSIGNAMLEVQSLLEPGKEHVLEARLEELTEEDASGDPPDAGENHQPS